MLHLILFDQPSWLFLQLVIREKYLADNELALFLCDCDIEDKYQLEDSLRSLGLKSGDDYILTADLPEFVEKSGIKALELVVLCYESHLKRAESIFSLIKKPLQGKYLSYYADSYVNIFISRDLAKDMFQNNRQITPRFAYSFDATRPQILGGLGWVEHRVIKSELIHSVMQRHRFYRDLVFEQISSLRSRFGEDRKYLLLVMRPWGSETFHGGMYRLKNAEFDLFQIVSDMIGRIIDQLGEDTVILYRTDARDRHQSELMQKFECLLEQEGLPGAAFVDLAKDFPVGITIEPYIYYFEELSMGHLSTAVFDSTTTLPFYPLGRISRHYLGANAALTTRLQSDESMTIYFQKKIKMSQQHLELVPTEYAYQKHKLTQGLVCYERLESKS